MPIMDDPEIIEDFINESNSLFDNLETILEDLGITLKIRKN